MPTPSLEQLFQAFLADGDEQALAQWMRRSAPTLRAAARRLGAGAEDAEDLVQETLVAAIHGAARWDATRPLLPWLKGILTFRAAKYARDARRRPAKVADDGLVEALVETAPPIVDGIAQRELSADVRMAIEQLPERYRAPLQQFLFAGRSPIEIATGLGLERATVRVHLHRGLARLRVLLQRWAGLALLLVLGRHASAGSGVRTARGVALLATLGIVVWLLFPPTIASSHATPPSPVAASPIALPTPNADALPAGMDDPVASARQRARAPGLRIRVRAADGSPLPHVGATLAPAAGRDPVLHRERRTSDASGELHFPTATAGRVHLRLDRGPEREFDLDAEAAVHEIVVTTGRTVHGVVRDPAGIPLAEAQVWLGEPGDPWHGADVATTDAAGAFTLRHVPPDAFVAARHAQFAGTEVRQVGDHGDCILQFAAPGASATVRVLDAEGAPATGALVFVGDAADSGPVWLADGAAPLRPPPFEARANADGEVTTPALPTLRQRLAVRLPGHAPFHGWLGADPNQATLVTLRHGLVVRGTVRDENGALLAGADVVHRSLLTGSDIDLVSDAAGRFEFESLAIGGNELAARAAGRTPRSCVLVPPTVGNVAIVEVALAVARTVRAHLVDARNQPLAGELRATWPPSQLDPAPRILTLDSDGRGIFADGRHGVPRLAFRPAGEPLWRDVAAFADWCLDDVVVTTPADFVADAWLFGTLRCADARPLHHARLFVHRDGTHWAEVGRTDAAGAFRLGPLPAGRYQVFSETTDPDLPTFVSEAIVLARGESRLLECTVPPAGRIDLHFALPGGEAVGDLVVTVVDRTHRRRATARTQPQVLQTLLPGDYLVFVMGSRVAWQEALPVHVDAGATTSLRVTLRAGHRVTFAPSGMPPAVNDATRTLTLHDDLGGEVGTWTLPSDHALRLAAVLAPGRYELRHTTRAATYSGRFEVDENGTAAAFVVPLTAH